MSKASETEKLYKVGGLVGIMPVKLLLADACDDCFEFIEARRLSDRSLQLYRLELCDWVKRNDAVVECPLENLFDRCQMHVVRARSITGLAAKKMRKPGANM